MTKTNLLAKWEISLPSNPLDWELTSILIGRPLAFILLYPIKNLVNPNLITIISLILSIVASFLLFEGGNIVLLSVLLFLSMVLDDGDGLVARYQNKTSDFGSFLDKTADIIRFGIIFPLFGYLAFKQDSNSYLLIIASLTPFMLVTQGYTKWLSEVQKTKIKISNQKVSPEKTKILGILNAILWPFHECDLTIWMIILISLNKISLLVWVLFLSQTVMAMISVISRIIDAYKRDKIYND